MDIIDYREDLLDELQYFTLSKDSTLIMSLRKTLFNQDVNFDSDEMTLVDIAQEDVEISTRSAVL